MLGRFRIGAPQGFRLVTSVNVVLARGEGVFVYTPLVYRVRFRVGLATAMPFHRTSNGSLYGSLGPKRTRPLAIDPGAAHWALAAAYDVGNLLCKA